VLNFLSNSFFGSLCFPFMKWIPSLGQDRGYIKSVSRIRLIFIKLEIMKFFAIVLSVTKYKTSLHGGVHLPKL
jgi:hypothetical protein